MSPTVYDISTGEPPKKIVKPRTAAQIKAFEKAKETLANKRAAKKAESEAPPPLPEKPVKKARKNVKFVLPEKEETVLTETGHLKFTSPIKAAVETILPKPKKAAPKVPKAENDPIPVWFTNYVKNLETKKVQKAPKPLTPPPEAITKSMPKLPSPPQITTPQAYEPVAPAVQRKKAKSKIFPGREF